MGTIRIPILLQPASLSVMRREFEMLNRRLIVWITMLLFSVSAAAQNFSDGAGPPVIDDDTTVLCDGKTWSNWQQRDGEASRWQVQDDGSVMVHGGDAITVDEYGDFQLHLEFRCPPMPEKTGQARGNSGVYLHGRYEVQVLDSFGQQPAKGSCGALYSIAEPTVNATRPAGQWQTYDIVFRAPRFDKDGKVTEHARVTVIHNGVVIHNNLELPHTTPGGIDEVVVAQGPLLLQDHGDPVRYRNIWVRQLD
jgi:hypothetical protein